MQRNQSKTVIIDGTSYKYQTKLIGLITDILTELQLIYLTTDILTKVLLKDYFV
jgi:hypothetical protein